MTCGTPRKGLQALPREFRLLRELYCSLPCGAVSDVLLFDLDETLMVEEPAAVAAFQATARCAATRYELDAAALAIGARARARELWHAAPTHAYCRRVGISSWEGLWCRYDTPGEDMRRLRAWAASYREQAWRLALADQGVRDDDLAAELADRFMVERRARHEVFTDARPTLEGLKGRFVLGLVTNGASCLQREKLRASGLEEFFDVVVVSGDVGEAKPSALPFQAALSALDAAHAVMIGDSVEKDIAGARSAGLDAVWVNRAGRRAPDGLGVPAVTSLSELPHALAALAA